ncbi:coiled-coil domain-containing protein [Saccharibacillus alkalitolerans]|uniref:Colicin import membrane protein n=1 Tax=Saccharibacillus alkalitolerans TaxID=2705290 RepID=A0ABX0FE76_9BACL|nr:hypothetical protein [Saccharibacillus alkalitolerans]NGZ77112.1 hypothetical protein [Saccharibacillus alkalitolerans]
MSASSKVPAESRRPVRFFALLLSLILAVSLALPQGSTHAAGDAWASALSGIESLYDGYTALETANKIEKLDIQSLRKDSAERLKAVNAAVKGIDKSKIDRLAAEAAALKTKHAALIAQYGDLGRQAAEARKRKDKKNADLLDLKRNKLKPSVDAAKLEIKSAKEALDGAKKQAAAKAKTVKDALAPVAALKKQVTAENKTIAAFNKTRAASYKRYRASVKAGNAITAAAEITLMYAQLGKIHASQQKIYGWEKQISAAIKSAAAKLPA